MASFGMVDYSRVDRINQMLRDAAARATQTQQMQYQADLEGLNLKLQLSRQEEANRLVQAYQRIMAGNQSVQQKAQMVGPLAAAASSVNPEVARFMSEGIAREYQGANLGIATERLGYSEREASAREKGLLLEEQRNAILARHYLNMDSREPGGARAARMDVPEGVLNRIYTERNTLDALRAARGTIAGGIDPQSGAKLSADEQRALLQRTDSEISSRASNLNDYMGSVQSLYGVSLPGYEPPKPKPMVPLSTRGIPMGPSYSLPPLQSSASPASQPRPKRQAGIISGTAPSFDPDEVLRGDNPW